MEALLAWSLAVFGAANGIVSSNLLEKFRIWVHTHSTFFGKLVHCPMCLGFWLGGIAHFLSYSPTNSLIFDMFLGSSVSWVGYLLIYDAQYRPRGECQGCQGYYTYPTEETTGGVNSP